MMPISESEKLSSDCGGEPHLIAIELDLWTSTFREIKGFPLNPQQVKLFAGRRQQLRSMLEAVSGSLPSPSSDLAARPRPRVACKWFMIGQCWDGANCPRSHEWW